MTYWLWYVFYPVSAYPHQLIVQLKLHHSAILHQSTSLAGCFPQYTSLAPTNTLSQLSRNHRYHHTCFGSKVQVTPAPDLNVRSCCWSEFKWTSSVSSNTRAMRRYLRMHTILFEEVLKSTNHEISLLLYFPIQANDVQAGVPGKQNLLETLNVGILGARIWDRKPYPQQTSAWSLLLIFQTCDKLRQEPFTETRGHAIADLVPLYISGTNVTACTQQHAYLVFFVAVQLCEHQAICVLVLHLHQLRVNELARSTPGTWWLAGSSLVAQGTVDSPSRSQKKIAMRTFSTGSWW